MKEAVENALRVARYANDHTKSVIETMEMKLGRAIKKESKRRKKKWKKRNKKIKKAMEEAKYMLSLAIDDADMKIQTVSAIIQRENRNVMRDDHSDAASTLPFDLWRNIYHTRRRRHTHTCTHRYSNSKYIQA